MRFAADSSVLLRLYLNADGADVLQRFLADDAKIISVSDLARVEVLNVLLREPAAKAARKFDADLVEGLRLRLELVDWPDAFQQAESLARRFARTLRPGAGGGGGRHGCELVSVVRPKLGPTAVGRSRGPAGMASDGQE